MITPMITAMNLMIPIVSMIQTTPTGPHFLDRLLLDVSPNLLLFFGQALIIILTVLGVVGGLMALFAALGMRPKPPARLEAKSLNDEWAERKRSLESFFLSKKEWKARLKEDRATEKSREEKGLQKARLWVLDYDGDIEASHTECLRHEITAILDLVGAQKDSQGDSQGDSQNGKKTSDEVLLRLESPGGTVTGYGLASAQLARLRQAGIKLTISIDEVAASGGYMMAAVADKIIASPFAVIGSIGVIGQLPNLHRLLKKYDVDYLEVTAGEFKRPVSMFGALTEEGMAKFKQQLLETHKLFRDHIKKFRPQLDIEKVANGDIWHGTDGLPMGLVDELMTSDEFIDRARHSDGKDVILLRWKFTKSLRDRFEDTISRAFARGLRTTLNQGMRPPNLEILAGHPVTSSHIHASSHKHAHNHD